MRPRDRIGVQFVPSKVPLEVEPWTHSHEGSNLPSISIRLNLSRQIGINGQAQPLLRTPWISTHPQPTA
jgi:hypothetical protein